MLPGGSREPPERLLGSSRDAPGSVPVSCKLMCRGGPRDLGGSELSGRLSGSSREAPGKLPGSSREAPGRLEAPVGSREAPGMLPGGSREAPRRLPASRLPGCSREAPGRLSGASREAPGRFPASSREAPGMLPGGSREAPQRLPGGSREPPGSSRQAPEKLPGCTWEAPGRLPGCFTGLQEQVCRDRFAFHVCMIKSIAFQSFPFSRMHDKVCCILRIIHESAVASMVKTTDPQKRPLRSPPAAGHRPVSPGTGCHQIAVKIWHLEIPSRSPQEDSSLLLSAANGFFTTAFATGGRRAPPSAAGHRVRPDSGEKLERMTFA